MKAILTLTAIIFFGVSAIAQNQEVAKVETKTVSVELNTAVQKEGKLEKEVARLYMFKNSRIKKELSFKTKRNKAKLA